MKPKNEITATISTICPSVQCFFMRSNISSVTSLGCAEQRTDGILPHCRQFFIRHAVLEKPSSVVRHSVMAAVYARRHVTHQPFGTERHFPIRAHHGSGQPTQRFQDCRLALKYQLTVGNVMPGRLDFFKDVGNLRHGAYGQRIKSWQVFLLTVDGKYWRRRMDLNHL